MSAPDPILEAATQFAHDTICECGSGSLGRGGWRNCYAIAEVDDDEALDEYMDSGTGLLAAVRPLIEAEVREAVARELDAKALRWRNRRDATDDLVRWTFALAYDDAARIARGGGQ